MNMGLAQRARLFACYLLPPHWGDSGGTLPVKDREIRVRTGKFKSQPQLGRGSATGVFSKGCVETEGFESAPQEERRYGMKMENFRRRGFSVLLTKRGNSEMRPDRGQHHAARIGSHVGFYAAASWIICRRPSGWLTQQPSLPSHSRERTGSPPSPPARAHGFPSRTQSVRQPRPTLRIQFWLPTGGRTRGPC
jgi:hypothetical protein